MIAVNQLLKFFCRNKTYGCIHKRHSGISVLMFIYYSVDSQNISGFYQIQNRLNRMIIVFDYLNLSCYYKKNPGWFFVFMKQIVIFSESKNFFLYWFADYFTKRIFFQNRIIKYYYNLTFPSKHLHLFSVPLYSHQTAPKTLSYKFTYGVKGKTMILVIKKNDIRQLLHFWKFFVENQQLKFKKQLQ